MNSTTLVSVIVPVYNMESFLAETLDSILQTTYPHIEVIVMDDGSEDASAEIARRYASRDARIRLYTQSNRGVSAARNQAIGHALGSLILPVDADNLLHPAFIGEAVGLLEAHPEVKAIVPRAEFFGGRTSEWKLPPFSRSLIARKNIMDTCAMYRKADWERVGGYCEEIVAREDWEFWIAVLKDGGEVIRTDEIRLRYRIRPTSKRTTDRRLKRHVIDTLNKRHPEFFERELQGRLHYLRSWSLPLNRLYRLFHPRKVLAASEYHESLADFIRLLPTFFAYDRGTVIHRGRNELRSFEWQGHSVVVKAFCVPNLINRIVYGLFRKSKAQRSFRNACLLMDVGIGTPLPLGYYTERNGLLFARSYYASMKSDCPYTYADLASGKVVATKKILRAIAHTTAMLHEFGFLHKDYSRGNILFGFEPDGSVQTEIVDLNRIRFQHVSLECGCKNFQRLPGPPEWFLIMAYEYAAVRGFDPEECFRLIIKHHRGH